MAKSTLNDLFDCYTHCIRLSKAHQERLILRLEANLHGLREPKPPIVRKKKGQPTGEGQGT